MSQLISKKEQQFNVHPAIIYSLITKQASGVPKALLELIMNSVDAQATRIDVTITDKGYIIADNGTGFKDEEAITSFFGMFGTPHEEGDAYYGRFRLGRAQSFGIARSKWYSKNFCMDVDLKVELTNDDKGAPLGYSVTKDNPFYQGCKIVGEFYEKQNIGSVQDFFNLSPYEKPENLAIIPALIKMIRYLPVDVFINDVKINLDINKAPISHTSNNANYLLNELEYEESGCKINVYNRGVYAYQIASTHHSGDVVSISALDLNIARNEAKATCPLHKEILAKIRYLDRKINQSTGSSTKRESRQARVIDSELSFSDEFWGMLLGFKEFNYDFFKSDFSYKSLLLITDEKISLKSAIERICKTISQSYTSFTIYDDSDFDQLSGMDVDLLTIENGFIPRSIFPSTQFMQKLTGVVYPVDSILHQQLREKFSIIRFENSLPLDAWKFILALCCAHRMVFHGSLSLIINGVICNSALSKDVSFGLVKDIEADQLTSMILKLDRFAKLDFFESMVLTSLRSIYKTNSDFKRGVFVVECNQDNVIAYTDGAEFIKFNEAYFKRYVLDGDFERIVSIFLHEYAHDGNTQNTHQHGASFFEKFNSLYTTQYINLMEHLYNDLALRIERSVNKDGVFVASEFGISEKALSKIMRYRIKTITACAS